MKSFLMKSNSVRKNIKGVNFMAKKLLWGYLIIATIVSILVIFTGGDMGMFLRILIPSILSVLAICESIQSLNKTIEK